MTEQTCTITREDGTKETFAEFVMVGFRGLDHYKSPDVLVMGKDTRVMPFAALNNVTPDIIAAAFVSVETLKERMLKQMPLNIACQVLDEIEQIFMGNTNKVQPEVQWRIIDISGN
jgi:hypothetical protein